MTDVYNPFSLLNALADKKLSNYWYQSGASKRLYDRLKDWDSPLRDLEGTMVSPRVLETGDVLGNDLEVLFYYTGYLTIKQVIDSFDGQLLVLGYPNQEVRDSFSRDLHANGRECRKTNGIYGSAACAGLSRKERLTGF